VLNAIRLPSGDQLGKASGAGLPATLLVVAVVKLRTKMSVLVNLGWLMAAPTVTNHLSVTTHNLLIRNALSSLPMARCEPFQPPYLGTWPTPISSPA
jgi:hypothetical protein